MTRRPVEMLIVKSSGENPMPPVSSPQHVRQQVETLDEGLFDYALIADWLRFTWHSVFRHQWLAIMVFAATLGTTFFIAEYMPRKYASETKLQISSTQLMSSLGNPNRNNQMEVDAPTRAAQETVMARDNLVQMIKSLDLVKKWEEQRTWPLRMKDNFFALIGGAPNDEQKIDNMVGTLEKRLNVYTGEGTVVIGVYWPDAQMAKMLAESAQRNFLESRYKNQVESISETINILEMHSAEQLGKIEDAANNAQRLMEQKRKGIKAPIAPAPKISVGASDDPAQEITQMKFVLRAKMQALADLEGNRARDLQETRAQIEQQRAVYRDAHPVIQDLQQRLAALQQESPQVVQLKRDVEDIKREFAAKGVTDLAAGTGGVSSRSLSTIDTSIVGALSDFRDDPTMMVAQDQLRIAMAAYQELLMRIGTASIELDTARAAFKFGHKIITPAQVPRSPISPNIPLIIFGGLLASMLFALLTCMWVDVRSGILLEVWQVERHLKLPVLAHLKR